MSELVRCRAADAVADSLNDRRAIGTGRRVGDSMIGHRAETDGADAAKGKKSPGLARARR